MDKYERQKMKQKHRREENILSAVFLLCLGGILLPVMANLDAAGDKTGVVREFPVSLATLTDRDPQEVDRVLAAREEADRQKESREQAGLNADGTAKDIDLEEVDIWSLFSDYVVLGDSRAYGFSYYDFLREDRVFADGGSTVRDALDVIPTVQALAPKHIYLCYGLNDTGIGYWANGDEYAEELRKVFKALKEACPDAVIIASSILPGTEAAYQESPGWRKIPDFDAALKKVCEEFGETYVDNNPLAAECMEDMWGPDGVHLDQEFYPLWAKNLYMATLERDNQ